MLDSLPFLCNLVLVFNGAWSRALDDGGTIVHVPKDETLHWAAAVIDISPKSLYTAHASRQPQGSRTGLTFF